MADFDLVIRRGTVVDGRGGEPFLGDVAVSQGRIAAVGVVDGRGRTEVDAKGQLVTPGFVDIHSHYDGQVAWEERMSPSSAHGVTTVVTGNCGVGFAPCRPRDRDRLVKLMEGVEDIPEVVLTTGLSWDWESFPEYLKYVGDRPHDVDVAMQIPHSALRVFVMGERAVEREPANADDIKTMAAITKDCMAAGAIGFGTSRTINHRATDGKLVPTLTAAEDELRGIALALKEHGSGVLQVVSDFSEGLEEGFDMLCRVVRASGRPLSFTLQQKHSNPDGWRTLLGLVDKANAEGLPIKAQILGRPSGLLMGHEVTLNPFIECPSYAPLAKMPLAQRMVELRKPEMRTRLLQEVAGIVPQGNAALRPFSRMFRLQDPPEYEPFLSTSIEAEANKRGIAPAELAYDELLENDGHALFFAPVQNYATGTLDPSLFMMKNENTVFGLGDGGAHYGVICDASVPTFMLSYWTRDRVRGEKVSVPWIVKRQCHDTARAVGLNDRGVIAPGYKADLNVIDYGRLALHKPKVVYDLPGKGRRIVQDADGYTATIVNGAVTYRDGKATGELPGKVVRGQQAAPTAA